MKSADLLEVLRRLSYRYEFNKLVQNAKGYIPQPHTDSKGMNCK